MSEEKKGFFARLKEGLTKTRDNIVKGFDSLFSGYSSIDDDFYEAFLPVAPDLRKIHGEDEILILH